MNPTTSVTTDSGSRTGRLPRALLALAAGLAAFLLVGAVVTAALEPRIEFSLLLGLPAGVVAGALTVAAVAYGLRTDGGRAPVLARGAGWFGVAFLVAAVGAVASGLLPVTLGLVAGVVTGLVAAAAGSLR
jgi:hypothetical protein